MPRLIKALRVLKMTKLTRAYKLDEVISQLATHLHVPPNAATLVILGTLGLVVNHVFACIWYYLGADDFSEECSTASVADNSSVTDFLSSSASKMVPSAARSSADTKSPVKTHLFFVTLIATEHLFDVLTDVALASKSSSPMSNARQPQYKASMTSVDVTSFSLKKRLTIPIELRN